ncbi:unnamed protein product [Ilex paraguariensis]|uniref:Peptidase S10, serine carboxypeptidase, Alpha/Beta hydrolase fold protein n=1 Tax=Ilex paraguariensis TaxID=185542 RepID=A0ABC8RYB9_9AQUA
MLFRLILLLLLSDIIASRSIVKTLPGYPSDLPFELETGYVGVGEKNDVQLFYYFVESEGSPKDDPLILWLAGGPGCSALRAFFYEIGPFTFNYEESIGKTPTLELNPYSWTKVASIIYIDQPVGTGFSYANTSESYISSDTISATQTYEFLRKWLVDHPEYLNNPLYICGVSYIGMVIPIIVQEIYNGNEAGNEPQMNIKGYMLGNPLTDKNRDINSRIKYAHRVALLSDNLYKSTKANCKGEYIDVDPSNGLCSSNLQLVDKCLDKINLPQILEPLCSTMNVKSNLLRWDRNSAEENSMDLLGPLQQVPGPWCRGYNYIFATKWANDRDVQKALNIREGIKTEWLQCNTSIEYSFGVSATVAYTFNVPSTVGYHRNLTHKNCRALIFSGDLDMRVPHLSTEKWIDSLNLNIESGWEPWFVDGQIAGYTIAYARNDYSLTYATMKGAGHTVPEYKPRESLAMVDRWFAYYPL